MKINLTRNSHLTYTLQKKINLYTKNIYCMVRNGLRLLKKCLVDRYNHDFIVSAIK